MQTVNTRMIQSRSQQNIQNGQHLILQWNCRGLENKFHEFITPLTK